MPFSADATGELVHEPMSGNRLMEIRRILGLKRVQFGQLLRLTGENRNIYTTIMRYEEGRRDISPMLEGLALMLLWFYQDHGYLPDLDQADRNARLTIEERADG